MAFCNQCGTRLPDDARFCARCGAALAPVPETVEQASAATSPLATASAPQKVGPSRPWLPIVAVVSGLLLVLAGFFVGLAIFDRDDLRVEEMPAAPTDDAGWTIAYVNDDGIQTLTEFRGEVVCIFNRGFSLRECSLSA